MKVDRPQKAATFGDLIFMSLLVLALVWGSYCARESCRKRGGVPGHGHGFRWFTESLQCDDIKTK